MSRQRMFRQIDEDAESPMCDLTNLIDLMVVMGALFLVLAATNTAISSTRYADLSIELTQTSAKPTNVDESVTEPLHVSIDSEGAFRIDDTVVTLAEIGHRLAAVESAGGDPRPTSLVIASDKAAAVEHAISLMAEASKHNTDISFVTLAESQP